MEDDKLLSIQEAAALLGVSTKTLRRWEAKGVLTAKRTVGQHRRYTQHQITEFSNQLSNNQTISAGIAALENQVTKSPLHFIKNLLPQRVELPQKKYGLYIAGAGLSAIVVILSLLLISGRFGVQLQTSVDKLAGNIQSIDFIFGKDQQTSKAKDGSVLASKKFTPNFKFTVNVPSIFKKDVNFLKSLSVAQFATVSGELTAPNIIYSVVAGTGIAVSTGQNPVITNTDPGSEQEIFKTLKVGSTSLTAASNTDTVELAAGSNVTLSTDTSTNKITIAATVPSAGISGVIIQEGDASVTSSATTLDFLGGDFDVGESPGGEANVQLANILTSVTGVAGNFSVGGSLELGSDSLDDFTGNGLQVSSGDLTLLLASSADALSSTTSNGSGLEVLSTGLTLLQGCANGQILKWVEASDTWSCSADDGGSGTNYWQLNANVLAPGGSAVVTDRLVLGGQTTTAHQFEVNGTQTGKALVSLNETGDQNILTASASGTTVANLDRSGNFTIEGQLADLTGNTLTVNDSLNLVSGNDFQINGTSVLNATTLGSAVVTSSLTSVGALNAGSITSGFGSIDIGSDSLTSGDITGSGTTGLTLSGSGADIAFTGGGTNILSSTGTLQINAFTLGGAITGNTQNITGLGQLTVDNLRLDGNTIDSTSGDITIDANGSNVLLADGDTLNVGGAAAAAFSFFADSTAGSSLGDGDSDLYIQDELEVDGAIRFDTATITLGNGIFANCTALETSSGVLTCGTDDGASAQYWQLNNGALSPFSDTADILVGGTATTSAKFGLINVNSGTPTATISAGTNGGAYLTATGTLQTTADQLLTLGGSTTGNILLDDQTVIGSTANGLTVTTAGVISDNNGNLSLNDNTDITGNLDASGTLTSGTADAFTVDATGNITSTGTTGLTLSGSGADIAFTGGGTNILSSTGTLQINAFTLGGTLSANSQTISGIGTASFGTNNVSITGTTIGLTTDTDLLSLANDALTVNGTATIGTLNAGATNTVVTQSSGTLQTRTIDARVWGSTLLDGAGAAGRLAFYSDADSLSSNANLFWDSTNNLLGIGTGSPTSKLHVTGTATGKALSIFDETGDQNIITASASGTTVANLDRSGNLAIEGALSDLGGTTLAINDNLDVSGTLTSGTADAFSVDGTGNITTTGTTGITLSGSGADIAFTGGGTNILSSTGTLQINAFTLGGTVTGNTQSITGLGQLTVDNLRLDGNTIDSTSGDITIDAADSNILFANGDVLNVGGAAAAAFNFFAGSTATSSIADGDNDLYIEDELEVDGAIRLDNSSITLGNAAFANCTALETSSGVLTCGSDDGGSQNLWQLNDGAISPFSNTLDVLIGQTATTSAKFAFMNVNSGTPTASISAGTNGGVYLTATGTLQTTADQLLTLGGNTTGNILLDDQTIIGSVANGLTISSTGVVSDNNGNLSLNDNTDITGNLDVSGTLTSGTTDAFTVDGTGNITTTGTTGVTLSGSGADISFTGGGTNIISSSSTLQINAFTLGGTLSANTQTISGIGTASFGTNNVSITGTTIGLTTDTDLLSLATNALTVNGTATIGTLNAGATDTVVTHSSGTLQTRTIDSRVWGSTLLDGAGAAGRLAFYSDADTLSSSATLFWDSTNNLLGIGTGSPTSKLHVTGSVTGKSLSIFDETGDQNIITASASGTTVANLDRSGNLAIEGALSDLGGATLTVNDNLDVSGTTGLTLSGSGADISFSGGGTNILSSSGTLQINAFTLGGTITGNTQNITGLGQLTVDNLRLDGNTIDSTSGDITIDANGSNVLLADGDTLNVGGAAAAAFNFFAASTATNNIADGDNDLYIEDELEVDGAIRFDNSSITLGNAAFTNCSALETSGGVLTCGSDDGGAAQYWQLNNGALSPFSDTADILVGGTATTSAKFGLINVNSGTPTATISAGTNGGAYLTATGILQTTADQLLTLGGNTTGNILLDDQTIIGSTANGITITTAGVISDNNGNLSLNDNTDITGNLDASGTLTSGTADAFTVDATGNITSTGTTGITLSGSGADLAFTGGGTNILSSTSTLQINAFTLGGTLSANSQTISGIGTASFGSGNVSITGATIGLTSDTDLLSLADNAMTVNGTVTVGTLNAGATNTVVTHSSGTLQTRTIDARVWGSTLIDGSGAAGRLAFYSDADSLSSNANLFWDSTNNLLGVGTGSPIAKLHTSGAVTGKALSIFDETGDQAILTASASGTTALIVNRSGSLSLYSTTANSDRLTIAPQSGGAATFTGTVTSADLTADRIYTFPNEAGTVCLTSGNCAGVGGVGDITAVGSMGTGDAFADSSADDDWLGLGASAGRIEFDDQTIDEVTILAAKLGIGTAAPDSLLHVTGAVTGKALAILDETGDQAIFTASKSGTTRFVIGNNGDITATSANGTDLFNFLTGNLKIGNASPTNSLDGEDLFVEGGLEVDGAVRLDNSSITIGHSNFANCSALETSSGVLTCGVDDGSGATNYWQLNNGAVSPFSNTVDVLIGATATTSAKFGFINVVTGTPTATISAGAAGGVSLTATGNLQTTADQLLTLGGNTTGNILLDDQTIIGSTANGVTITTAGVISDNNGNLSLNDNTDITGNLDVSGTLTSGTTDAFTVDATGNLTTSGTTGLTFSSTGGIILAGGTLSDGTDGVDINDDLEIAGNTTFGDAITDSLTFTARVAQDSDLLPITATGTNDLGSASLPWDNLYVGSVTQNGSTLDATYAPINANFITVTANGTLTGETGIDALTTAISTTSTLNVDGSSTLNTTTIDANANLILAAGSGALGVGLTPVHKLDVSGTVTGKALVSFNDTGSDQNILTASASGTTVLNLDRSGNLAVEGALSDLGGTTLAVNDNLDVSGTLTSGTADAFSVDATGNIASSGTTGLTLSGSGADISFSGGGTNILSSSGTLQINAFTLGGTITGNTQNITGLGQLTVDNLRLDGNTIDSTSGDITIDANDGNILFADGDTLNIGGAAAAAYNFLADSTAGSSLGDGDSDLYIQDELEVDGAIRFDNATITLGNAAFTNCTSLETSSGALTCGSDDGGTNYWQLNNGAISPFSNTLDVLIGQTATTSAKFGFINVNNGTPTATISAGTNGGVYLNATGTLQTTADQLLTLGGDTTGNILLNDQTVIGSTANGLTITTAGVLSDNNGNLSLNDNTDITGNLDISGTLTSGTADAFQVDANGNITSTGTTGLTLSGSGADIAFTGGGTNILSSTGTLQINAFTLGGTLSANSQTISGIGTASFGTNNVSITGTTIGLTTDTDLLSLANDALTVNGTITAATNETINGIDISAGVISDATWNGTAIGALYGGTGDDTSGTTGVPYITAGNWQYEAALDETRGGTGLATYATGDLIYASGTDTLARRAIGTTGDVLTVSGGVPTWVNAGVAGINFWQRSNGAVAPINITDDLLLGATATTSAKFGLINIAGNTPTATISANSGDNATFLSGTGNLGTTNMQILSLGGSTTGNITATPGFAAGIFNVLTGNLKVGNGVPTTALDGEDAYVEGGLEVDGTSRFDGTIDSNGDVTIADTDIAFDGASTTFTTTGAFTLTPGGAVLLGDGGDTMQINSSDWDISTTGDLTNIGSIGADGDFTMTQGTPSILLVDSDGSSDDYSVNVNANVLTIVNDTDSRTELSLAGDGGIDFGDNTATKTIDIGGVTSSAVDTINIATNSTAADTLTIGNNNASTLFTLTGGDDWSITSAGVLTLDGTALDIDSLDFTGAGAITTGGTTDLTLNPTDEVVFGDTDTLIIGGHAGNVAYNVISDSGGSPTSGQINSDDDLFVEGVIEASALYQGANQVCDSSGNCAASTNYWQLNSGNIAPGNAATVTDRLSLGGATTTLFQLGVSGTQTGKALLGLNDTGTDQNILTASASGTTVANLDRSGSFSIEGSLSDLSGTVLNINDDLEIEGNDILASDSTTAITLSSANVTVAGDLTVSGGDIVSVATTNLLNTTTTTLNFAGAATTLNIADAAITGTIDLGGVTADGATTVNIATNSTSADTITIGNNNASTLFTLTGGDDWSITSGGVLTLDGTALDIDSLDFTGVGALTTASGDLTLNPTDEIVFGDTDTFIVGGHAGNVAYNVLSNSGGAPGSASIDTDNDLFIEGSIEVDGASQFDGTVTVSDLSCTDCLDFTEFANSMSVDEATDINLGANQLSFDLDSSGDLVIRDGTTTFVTFEDDSTVDFLFPAAGQLTLNATATNSTINGAGTGVFDLSVDAGSVTSGETQQGFYLDFETIDDANADQTYRAMRIDFTNSSEDAGDLTHALSIRNVNNTSGTAVATDAFIRLDNADATAASLTDGLLIVASGVNNGITDAIDLSDANLNNALNLGGNFALFDGIRAFEGSTGTLTFEDTSGNDLATLTDNANAGDFALTGDLTVTGGDILSAATANLLNATSTIINFGSAATTLNIADAAITGTIDLGGVTADGATTINIATNGTSADTLTVGNSNASTTLALTGGDDWSITSGGAATFAGTVTANGILDANGTVTLGDGGDAVTIDSNALTLQTTGAGTDITFNAVDQIILTDFTGGGSGCSALETNTSGHLVCGTDDSGGTNYWQLNNGAISPFSNTLDVLIGQTATTSAKFGFLNVNANTPTASISANSGNNATYLTGLGKLATTNMQNLTLGDSTTTGTVIINPSGNVGIGTTAPAQKLDVLGNFQVKDADSATKAYRFRTNGSDLDFDAAGDWIHFSTFQNADYTGTQRNFLTLKNDADFASAYYNWEFKTSGDAQQHLINSDGGVVFNETGGAFDLRVEGDTYANLLFVQGSTDRVGIGTNAPVGKFSVSADGNGRALVVLDETGTNQNILTASASGTTVFNLDRSGNVSADGVLSFGDSTPDDNAYNTIGTGDADNGGITNGEDFYISGDFEVDGTVADLSAATVSVSDLSCTDCLDFTEFANSMTIDEATDINLSTFALSIDLDNSGDFSIRDVTTDIATFSDSGSIAFAPTSGTNFGVTAAGAGAVNITTATGAQTFSSSVVTGTTTSSAFVFSDTALTTGTNLYVVGTSTPVANTATTQNIFATTFAQGTTANTNGFAGLGVNFTQAPTVSGNTEYAMRIQNQATGGSPSDAAVAALLILDNADTSTGNSVVVTDALRITNSGAIASGITNGITFASINIANGLNFSSTPGTAYVEGTNWDVDASGNEVLAGDLTVSGGDIVGAATTNVLNAATTVNLGSTAVTRTINLGTGTNADTINIGTGGTTADIITIGATGLNGTNGSILNLPGGFLSSGAVTGKALGILNETGDQDIFSASASGTTRFTLGRNGSITATSSATTLPAYDFVADSVTSGSVLSVSSLSTSTTAPSAARLGYFNWSPSSSTTFSGDLIRFNIGSNGNVSNILNVTDNGTSLFSVGETQITSALPHQFTAAGDVSMAYDLVMTNQTASYIKSYGPLTVEAGESFESNDLTLATYNSGRIVLSNSAYANCEGLGTDSSGTLTCGQIMIRKASDEASPLNSTALQDDNELTFSIGANETYVVQVNYTYTTNSVATNDIRVAFNAPSGATCTYGVADIAHAGNANAGSTACDTAIALATTATGTKGGILTGTITTGATAGSVVFRWAQGTADAANATTVEAGSSLTAYRVFGADYAEVYYTKDSSILPGTVVAVDGSLKSGVKKTNTAYDNTTIGIVSTQPGKVIGDAGDGKGTPVLLALNGRVPVRINEESGKIKAGDYLTSSSTPGVAMKATKAGPVIAKALEDQKDGIAMVMAFVNISWYEPNITITADGDITIAEDPNSPDTFEAKTQNGQKIDTNAFFKDAGIANLTAGAINAQKIALDGVDLIDWLEEQITEKTQAISPVIADNETLDVLSASVASQEAKLSSADQEIASLSARVLSLENMLSQQASDAAFIQSIIDSPLLSASASADLDTALETLDVETATISGTLNVLGRAVLNDVGITGNITAGIMSIHGLDGEINTLGGPLKLQPLGLEAVEIMAGKVTIDTDGNIATSGKVIAEEVQTKQIKTGTISIETDLNASASAILDTSAGVAVIKAGQTKIDVNTTALTTDSLLFATPEQVVAVGTKKKDSDTFTISIQTALPTDLKVNWWIVN